MAVQLQLLVVPWAKLPASCQPFDLDSGRKHTSLGIASAKRAGDYPSEEVFTPGRDSKIRVKAGGQGKDATESQVTLKRLP